jgi:hypothetical protein
MAKLIDRILSWIFREVLGPLADALSLAHILDRPRK